jgi:uncharacterized membrane protein
MNPPRITATIAGRALHPLLRPFASAYFLAVLGCDLLYSSASSYQQAVETDFATITEWLLAAGLVAAGLALVVAAIDFLGEPLFRKLPDLGMFAAGGALVVLLGLTNFDLRITSGADAIAPMGLALSLATAAVLIATPSRAWARLYRRR